MNTEEVSPFCLNCNSPLNGEFCSRCGQKSGPLKEGFLEFVKTFFCEILDSKSLRTTKHLLLRPGFLTHEYYLGRRIPYAEPIKMFLFFAAINFFLLFHFPEFYSKHLSDESNPPTQTDQSVSSYFAPDPDVDPPGLKAWAEKLDAKKKPYYEVIKHEFPEIAVLCLPFLALIFALLYKRAKLTFTGHVVFQLHYFSFVSLCSIIWIFAIYALFFLTFSLQPERLLSSILIPVFVSLAYLYLAMRRFYGQSKLKTLLKYTITVMSYFVAFIVLCILAFLVCVFIQDLVSK